MRRILVLLSVVAMMVVMLAMSVAPAFAAWTGAGGQCKEGGTLLQLEFPAPPSLEKKDRNGDRFICQEVRETNQGIKVSRYDNRDFIPPA
jgi:hypothetical protein